MDDDNTVKMIVAILIGVGYAIVTVVKKIDRWIQTHRIPHPPQQESSPVSPPRSVPTRPSAPEQPRPAQQQPQTPWELLRGELEKAFGGAIEDEERQETFSMPRPAPRPRPVPERIVVQEESEGPRFSVRGRTESLALKTTPQMPGVRKATLHHGNLSHLAVLRSPEDMKRAMVIHEILAPPKALRPRAR